MEKSETLDDAAVKHVAGLARLRINEDEVSLYAEQLSRILAFVRQLNEVDTSDIEPMAHPLPIANRFRGDVLNPKRPVVPALTNAPDHHDGYFRVVKVLESP